MFDFETPDDADGVTVDLMSGTVTFQDSRVRTPVLQLVNMSAAHSSLIMSVSN